MANGTLKVQNIETSSGSGTITLGQSGETVVFGSGVTTKFSQPAFEVYLSASQTISHNSATKVQFDTEILDTDNCYDNSTNYRFTPTVAGKYYIYAGINLINSVNDLQKARAIIYKNGSEYRRVDEDDGTAGTTESFNETVSAIIDFNGSSDYVEIYTLIYQNSGTTSALGASYKPTYFGAYRLGVE